MSGSEFRDHVPGTVRMPFGCGHLAFPLLPGVSIIETPFTHPLENPVSEIEKALLKPLGTPPLRELASGRKDALIVVSDRTRPVPNHIILPPLLRALNDAGINNDAITILIATGMHEPTPLEEFGELYGKEALSAGRIVNHDATGPSGLSTVATLGGAPVELNSLYVNAGLRILTGLIEPHRLAGFSGGGKAVVPGISGINLVRRMHSYRMVESIGDGLGVIDGNPFREAIDAVLAVAGADFAVNVTVNGDNEISGVFAGEPGEVFHMGASFAAETGMIYPDVLCDAAVTTGGGSPKDKTLYQAVKGLVAVAPLVKPGGTLLMAAECAEGTGSASFAEVLKNSGSAGGFRRIYSDPARFTVDQWAVQAVLNSISHLGRVMIYSPALDEECLACLGMEKCPDFGRAAEELATTGRTVFLVPEGPHTAVTGQGKRVQRITGATP